MRMQVGRVLAPVAIIAIAIGLGAVGITAHRRAHPEECFACKRPIHEHSRTIAVVRGHSRLFCCPACALSEERQEGKAIDVKELTAFLTGEKLSPDTAYIVSGSDVNMCARKQELLDADKRAASLYYDRCAPSLLAFRAKREAQEFSRQHGGTVRTFSDAAAVFNPASPHQH
jgi:hypothetical protein